jgi:16S rRNA A1518/A1519 N6-dimethyltransferase RsmA/KsgA/DIM1 with predicted DNA glycosylase/AP lyase activity
MGSDKTVADEILKEAKINGNLRAQNLGLADWHQLLQAVNKLMV